MHKGISHTRYLFLFLLIIIIGLFATQTAGAQEPTCPPGFYYRRMSGVGCVQINCEDISNAKYSSTTSCICQDGYSACRQPVDYGSFNQDLCGPHCPTSELISCVSSGDICPGEEPAPLPTPQQETFPTAEPFFDNGGDSDNFDDPNEWQNDPDNRDFVEFLEVLFGGNYTSPASSGQEAAGAITGSALLGAWVLINMLSGGDMPGILGQLFGGKSPSTPSSPLAAQSGISSPTPPAATSSKPPAQQAAGNQPPLDPSEYLPVLQDKFQEIVKAKVKEGYYVRNPTLLKKIWNNFPITSSLGEKWGGLTGGQCGEFAGWGNAWIKDWAKKTYGPGVVVDTIWVGEESSRNPDGLANAADALYQDNHIANRIILPNGESMIVDFWDGITKYRDGKEPALPTVKPIPEDEWVQKWRDKVTWHDTIPDPFDKYAESAEVSNVNKHQNSLRNMLNAYDIRHPTNTGGMSHNQIQENNEQIGNAINEWHKANESKIPPEERLTIIENWRKHGTRWGRYQPDPPLDPVSAVMETGFDLLYGAPK